MNGEVDRQLLRFVFAFTVIVDVFLQCGKGDLDLMTMPDLKSGPVSASLVGKWAMLGNKAGSSHRCLPSSLV